MIYSRDVMIGMLRRANNGEQILAILNLLNPNPTEDVVEDVVEDVNDPELILV